MKKLILLPILATSFIMASNIDDAIKNIQSKEYTKAINILKQQKETKKVDCLLGKAYYQRHLTYTDYILAAKYLTKAKTANANYYLGKLYEKGLGVKQNINKALNYYKISNTKEANFALSNLYLKGKYILKNPKLAILYLKKSAKQGYDKAQYLLGKMYLKGNEALNKDLSKAAKWLKASTKNGEMKAKKLWEEYKLYKY